MKILAVDDDEIILELLQATMAAAGFDDVTTVTSGAEALNALANSSQQYDCLLLDIQMPEMDGIELCDHIRAIPVYEKTPIIMITAMSDRGYVDRAFQAGASDYVTKPFDVLELGTRVKLAKRLSDERQNTEDSIFANETLKEQLSEAYSFDLAESIPIKGIKGVLEHNAFDNYLLQLARGSLSHSKLFAFKIADVESLYASALPSEFVNSLTDIAEAISDNLEGSSFFLSYRGNGVFGGISHSPAQITPQEMEASVRSSIKEMELCYNDGEPLDVDLRIGEFVSPGYFSNTRPLQLLWQAIDSAESQPSPRIAQSGFEQSPEDEEQPGFEQSPEDTDLTSPTWLSGFRRQTCLGKGN